MSALPFYKRDPRRALRGMAKLNIEQRGVYQTLQDMIYDRGGPIEDDERFLAGQMMISIRKWRALRDQLLELGRIALTDDGRIFDETCLEVLEAFYETHQERVDSGRKGGVKSGEKRAKTSRKRAENELKTSRKRAENEPDQRKNNDLCEAKLPKNLRAEDKKSSALNRAEQSAAPLEPPPDPIRNPKSEPRPLDRCLAAAGPGLGDPVKFASLQLSAHRIAAAMAAGCDLELDILPVIAAKTAKARGDPIATWSYFDRPWADARDKRLAAFAAPDSTRFAGEPHGQTHRPPRQRGGTGSYVDAALRLIDRTREVEAKPEWGGDGCLEGEIVPRSVAIAGA